MGGLVNEITGVAESFNPLRPGGDVLDDFSGRTGAEAALAGAQLQHEATLLGIDEQRAARESQQALLQPFVDLGLSSANRLTPLLEDQVGYLERSPLFQAALGQTQNRLENRAAAGGRFGSGGLVNELFNSYLSQGQNFLNQDFNRLFNVASLGQASAAGVGSGAQGAATNIADLLGTAGAAQAAGGIGAANALGQGSQNLAGLAGLAASFFSDERLKDGMELVGKDENGMNVYKFKYKTPEYIGYSAQEVADKDPANALLDPSGFLKVTEKYEPVRIS